MRELVVVVLCALSFFGIGTAAGQDQSPINFDTDFVMPRADDGMALILARKARNR